MEFRNNICSRNFLLPALKLISVVTFSLDQLLKVRLQNPVFTEVHCSGVGHIIAHTEEKHFR